MDAGAKVNLGFGPFIREGVATPGFYKLSSTAARMIPTASYEDLKKEILLSPRFEEDGARQVAMWLKDATVGSFVIIRNEYEKCPFRPAKLKDLRKVYAIGVVTKVVKPFSEEEKQIATERLRELPITQSFCLVSWEKLGMKESLLPNSQSYINKICQPTLAKILQPGKKWEKYSAIRRDLWDNATIPISPADFLDSFDRETCVRVLKERKAEQYLSSEDES